jgi:hypothetical protein
MAAAAAA